MKKRREYNPPPDLFEKLALQQQEKCRYLYDLAGFCSRAVAKGEIELTDRAIDYQLRAEHHYRLSCALLGYAPWAS